MIRILDCIIESETIFLFVFSAFSFLDILRTKRRLGLVFLSSAFLMILWRSFFQISTSRYCAIFIVMGLLVLIVEIRNIDSYRRVKTATIICICAGLVCYNTIKSFSSFRDIYILDVKEDTRSILHKNHDSKVSINPKEYGRISEGIDNKYISEMETQSSEELEEFLNLNRLWWNGVYLILKEKQHSNLESFGDGLEVRKVGKWNTNKKKTNIISIYRYQPKAEIVQAGNNDGIDSGEDDSNIITNGDIELTENSNTVKKKFSDWIRNGAVFYDSASISFPQATIILPTWTKPDSTYPKVFADSSAPIQGKYSLNVSFGNSSNNTLYFLNYVPNTTGTFSFLVKNLSSPAEFRIARYDFFENGEVRIANRSTRMVLLTDENIYKIRIDSKKENENAYRSVFYLTGNNLNLLIDEISFIQQY